MEALAPAAEGLRREANPVVMKPDELRDKMKARDRFVARIAREPRILPMGDDSGLGQPRQDSGR